MGLPRRLSGRMARLDVEIGKTQLTGTQTFSFNSSSVEQDGVVYPAYSIATAPTLPFSAYCLTNDGAPALTLANALPSASGTSPNYEFVPARGQILFTPAQQGGGSATTCSIATTLLYTPNLQPLGDLFSWSFSTKNGVIDVTGMGDTHERAVAGYYGWGLSASCALNDASPWAAANIANGVGLSALTGQRYPLFVKLFPSRYDSTSYFLGTAWLDLEVSADKNGVETLKITGKGQGPLVPKAS